MRAPLVTLRLPYVYSIPDRHGNDRLYFWRGKGHPRIRLREQPGTAVFHQRYDELLSLKRAHGMAPPQERTLCWLCAAYQGSAEFRRLEKSTQKERRLILESICLEPVVRDAKERFDRFTSKAVRPRDDD
jgi:hypothetical protein